MRHLLPVANVFGLLTIVFALTMGVPLLDSLACLVRAGIAAARLGAAKPAAGSFAAPPSTPSIGLSAPLAAVL